MSKAQAREIKELSAQLNASSSKLSKRERELNTAQKRIKDLVAVNNGTITFNDFVYVAFNEIYTLLLNAVKITGVSFIKENFIKRALFEKGQVGYLKTSDIWAYVSGESVNGYGFPVSGIFSTAVGLKLPNTNKSNSFKLSYDKTGDAFLILANEFAYPLIQSILVTCETMSELDVGILQNVRAVRVPRFVAVTDEDDAEQIKLSLEYANQDIQKGVPVIKITEGLGKALNSVTMPIELVADKLLLIKEEIRNQLLTRLGILTANSNKRERVQVGEVNAHVGECVDSIYVVIDCFNKQMQTYGLPFSMELNGVIETMYGNEDEQGEEGARENERPIGNDGGVDNP